MVVNTEDQTREYMLSRAKACLQKGDPSYAKSWIMTANALFPQNDKIKVCLKFFIRRIFLKTIFLTADGVVRDVQM